MNRTLRAALLGGAVLLSLNCGGGGTENNDPVAGPLSVVLTSPTTNDAAVLLTVRGLVAPTSFVAGTGLELFQSVVGTTSRVILTGPMTSGSTILTINVTDTRDHEDYTVSVDEVASTTYRLRTPSAYQATVEK